MYLRGRIWFCARSMIMPSKFRLWNIRGMCHAGAHHAGAQSISRPRGTITNVVITTALRHKAGNATGSS